jgi:CheY-like chemotaxis protein
METWIVVEDEPDLYDMILAMYATLGVNGVAFATGREATDWLHVVNNGHFHDELPTLALIDIRLPDEHINGIDIASQIRRSPYLTDITIIMMTAYRLSPEQEREALYRSGADHLLYKPLPKLDVLERLFHELIARRQGRSAP